MPEHGLAVFVSPAFILFCDVRRGNCPGTPHLRRHAPGQRRARSVRQRQPGRLCRRWHVPGQPGYGDNPSVDVMASYNGYCVSGSTPIISGMADSCLDLGPGQVEHRVSGTIYTVADGARYPWSRAGHAGVFVNGVPATVDGATYAAVLRAPADGEPLDIAVIDKGGYTLGESSGHVDLSGSSDSIDVEVPSLEVSGDVYSGGVPVDGASVVIYDNDRPVGPIVAHAGAGPMFSKAIDGGHPGDRITVAASEDDEGGIAIQDTPDYSVFLTVNLQKTGPWKRDVISRLYCP